MTVLLLRHGQTAGNALHLYIGRTDESLDEIGVGQAMAAQNTVSTPNCLYVSPKLRCKQTAGLIWPHVEQKIIPGFRETDFGEFEGKGWEQLKEDLRYRNWIDGTGEIPGGETRQEVKERIHTAWKEVLENTKTSGIVAIVTHGGTIMEIMLEMFGGDMYDYQSKNCHGFSVEFDDELQPIAYHRV